MKILGLIPARGGSKGVLRKNIRLLSGIPLIQYTINSAIACKLIDSVVVSTEDLEIAAISEEAGADVPFLRPVELASDAAPTIDTIVHALRYFKTKGEYFDAVCLLQPTVPFRDPKNLENAIQLFMNNDVDSVVSMRPVPHVYNPYWVYNVDAVTGLSKKVISDQTGMTRRQNLPDTYHRDGSVYITAAKSILKHNTIYGESSLICEMTSSPNINIDSMEDWQEAERYILNLSSETNE